MFPRLAGSSDTDAHAATTRVCRHTLFILALGVAGFAIGGPIVIPLFYGRDYTGAIMPLLVLLPGLLLAALYQLLARNFTSRGRQEVNILAACLALSSNVGLNILMIPRYGIVGAAAAHGLSYGLAALTLLVAFVRDSGHSAAETLVIRPSEIGAMARTAWGLTARLR
jgi:O-antigen/teichoic acid export membrane protein